ncbi:hypothetical protein [uncultured Pseudomonas sp.]|uniref:hypothetical protein n=1 Tax=uncultured Pseudomonas sp. TaxID=114707 RepID=UPI0025D5755E|nr:hypothetical protein [uncultured Pseudomonas sp.]
MTDDIDLYTAEPDDSLPRPILVDSTDQLINLDAAFLRVQLPAVDPQAYDRVRLVLLATPDASRSLQAEADIDTQGAQAEFYKHDLQAVFDLDDEVVAVALLRRRGTQRWVRSPGSETAIFC